MFKTKIIAATLAVATLAGTIGTASAGGYHHHHHGAGIGLGIAAGALVGAAVASNAYGSSYGYQRCKWVRQYDGYGYYTGTVKVCRY